MATLCLLAGVEKTLEDSIFSKKTNYWQGAYLKSLGSRYYFAAPYRPLRGKTDLMLFFVIRFYD